MQGFFGNMFDFNHNGQLSSTEQATELAFLQTIINETKKDKQSSLDELSDYDLLDED